jgi:regulator of ribonuclease activity A
MRFSTADLCDEHGEKVRVVAPIFRNYGGAPTFHGEIATVRVFEDNLLVRDALSRPGQGKVLVVDGGGSLNCALIGNRLAALAHENGWAGVLVNGCIRDSAPIATIAIGVCAVATHPRKSAKRGSGDVNVIVSFANVNFVPGEELYSDEDGIIVCSTRLF